MEPPNDVPKPMSVISRIVNVFISPAETFQALVTRPDWITPLVLSMVLFLVTGTLLKDVIQKEQERAVRKTIMESTPIADLQKEQIADQQIDMMKKFWFVGVIFGVVIVGGMFFLGGWFLRMGGKIILGGQAPYLLVLSVFGYSRLIDVLATAVKLPAMVTKGTMRVDTGLGWFVPDADITSASYTFLSKFDLFTCWELAVLTIGVSVVYKFTKTKSALLVVGLWLIWVLAQTGLAAVGVRLG